MTVYFTGLYGTCELCNFDKFYIYDFSIQDEPLDKIDIENLEKRVTAFNFLYPKKKAFLKNNLEDATRETADDSLIEGLAVINHVS